MSGCCYATFRRLPPLFAQKFARKPFDNAKWGKVRFWLAHYCEICRETFALTNPCARSMLRFDGNLVPRVLWVISKMAGLPSTPPFEILDPPLILQDIFFYIYFIRLDLLIGLFLKMATSENRKNCQAHRSRNYYSNFRNCVNLLGLNWTFICTKHTISVRLKETYNTGQYEKIFCLSLLRHKVARRYLWGWQFPFLSAF